jgi:hypothetical protein
VATKITQWQSSFGYSPTWLLSIITTPLCLNFFSLPLYLFGPLSMGLLAYIKADKDKQDTSLARGIMSDPNVSHPLSLTHSVSPHWLAGPEVHRVRAPNLDSSLGQ